MTLNPALKPPPTVTVQRMRWWDLTAILPIEQILFPKSAWTAEMYWSELSGVPQTRRYLVAKQDDEIVGYAGVVIVGADADVQTIGVRPDAHRQGIGTLLIDHLETHAAERGATRMFLEVSAENDAAHAMYLARGYQASGRRRDYYARGVDAVVMVKRLDSSTDSS